jgi:hypothetical protein
MITARTFRAQAPIGSAEAVAKSVDSDRAYRVNDGRAIHVIVLSLGL